MAEKKDHNNIDDFFSQKLRGDQAGHYHNQHWLDMQDMLDQELPVSSKNRRPIVILFSLIGLGIIGSLLWNQSNSSLENNRYSPVANNLLKLDVELNGLSSPLNFSKSTAFKTNPEKWTQRTEKKAVKAKLNTTLTTSVEQNTSKDIPATNLASSNTIPLSVTTVQNRNDPENKELQAIEIKKQPDTVSNHSLLEPSVQTNQSSNNSASGIQEKPYFTLQDRLYIIGGANYSTGFSNTEAKGENAIDPILGISYQKEVSLKWAINIGAHYLSRSQHHLKQENESISYFLNKRIEKNAVEVNKMESFEFPISMSFLILPKHRLNAGIFGGVLLNTKSKKSRTSISGAHSQTESKEGLSGYYAGLETFNYGWTVGYEYRLFLQGVMEVRYQKGLVDMTHSNYYPEGNKHQSSDVQLVFKYRFLNY